MRTALIGLFRWCMILSAAMPRIAWSTDTHLNFLHYPKAPKAFGEYLAAEQPFDSMILTGDISEGPEVVYHVKQVQEGFVKPVYFIMGNHDYYMSSFAEVDMAMAKVPGWLTKSGVVEIDPGVALVGHEGWYDAEYGHAYARFNMADWSLIGELKSYISRDDLLAKIRAKAQLAAKAARPILEAAIKDHELVLFATHFPPFKGACWHEGGLSNDNYLPWFSSKAMGDILLEVASANPTKRILVLCGHTHSFGIYDAAPNLKVLTGKAKYGSPDLTGVLEIADTKVLIRMKDSSWADRGIF